MSNIVEETTNLDLRKYLIRNKLPYLDYTINASWDLFLPNLVKSEYFKNLINYLNIFYNDRGSSIFPKNIHRVFEGFERVHHSDVKVVIIGGEPRQVLSCRGIPYANEPSTRLADYSDELYLIYKCISNTIYDKSSVKVMMQPDLYNWSKQGILLLYSSLTAKIGQLNAHDKIWREFMSTVIEELSKQKKDLIFLFLGPDASKYSFLVDKTKHNILMYTGPESVAKLRYKEKTSSLEWNCPHFKTINSILERKGEKKIIW